MVFRRFECWVGFVHSVPLAAAEGLPPADLNAAIEDMGLP